ncbi:MAG TPA: HU family DNA-binding protein [Cyclobacteriaceae bacterium]|nr:HU family DNA-binding protein [Cyclobacteriaceae bacterium]
MTRKELAKQAPQFETVLKAFTATLRKGEQIDLRGFGTFKVIERKAKKGRNVYTGEAMDIPARKIVKFYPSHKLLSKQ